MRRSDDKLLRGRISGLGVAQMIPVSLMIPFTTDHPMMTEPSAFSRRVQRWLLWAVINYGLYLLLLGPLVALAGNGYLNWVPESAGRALFLPAAPVAVVPGLQKVFRNYFDWWYHDPSDPYSSPDWR